MSPVGLLVLLLLAASGVWLGSTLDGSLPWVWIAVLSVPAYAAVQADVARRLRKLTTGVSAWLAARSSEPLPVRGRDAWGQHAVVLNALGLAHDRGQAELAREQPWRRELVDSLLFPALLFGSDARLLAANDAARELFQIQLGATEMTLVQAVGSPALIDSVNRVRATGEAVTIDTEHADRDLQAVTTQIGDETLLLVNDRTRERRTEELRRNFVVNASHELKTPVTAIRTLSEALGVTVDTDRERTRHLLRRLDQETRRLARLVYDLLDLRRLEERAPMERTAVDLAELVRRAVVDLLDRAAEEQVEIDVEIPDRAMVVGVEGDLQVVVENLIGNALQYNTPGGRIVVELEPENGVQVLTVRDTGIGIPLDDMRRVFERFYRVDTARSRETGGTGLGLAIVRHAVESHGGAIDVDSVVGEGTTFTVRLPVEPRH